MKIGVQQSDILENKIKLKKKLFARERRNIIPALGFLILPLIVFTIFVIVPVVQAAVFSLFKWKGLGPLSNFTGIKNFIKILTDGIFHTALKNNFLVVFFSLTIQLPIALLIALAIGRNFKGSIIFRTIFFLPFILAEVIAGVIWLFIYNPQFGIQNTFISKIIPGFSKYAFVGDPNIVFYAIFLVVIWKYFGFHMIIYIAGLQNIPDELEEAAFIDGVNKWQLNWHIILPLLKPALLISVFFSIIGSFQLFDLVWVISKGGPVHASETMVTYLYNFGFIRFNLGYGSAVAVIIFLICLIFNILYQKFIMVRDS
jgi:raffinose/stachyose/melibiose transport system permease protein